MKRTIPTPRWEAWPKNDRLKRWCVVDAAASGTGKPVIADNIRQEAQARHIAASLDMLDALNAARAILVNILGDNAESQIIAEQMAMINSALFKAQGSVHLQWCGRARRVNTGDHLSLEEAAIGGEL